MTNVLWWKLALDEDVDVFDDEEENDVDEEEMEFAGFKLGFEDRLTEDEPLPPDASTFDDNDAGGGWSDGGDATVEAEFVCCAGCLGLGGAGTIL